LPRADAACRKKELMAAVQAHDKPLKAKVRETERLAAFQKHLEQLERHGGEIQISALDTICSQVLLPAL
jgi:hypothetical protein